MENDPVNWVDPFGLMPEVPGDGTVVDPDDGLSAAEKDLAASRELSIKDEEIMKETLHKQELVGIAEIVVGGIGIFAGGNVPAAFVMADGAIRYTKAKYAKEFYSTRDSIRFISELSTPAVKNLAEELWERHDD
ncbi:hypothetical protein B4O97_18780 [Marispirochaeta aestuarii]|uniref:Uncharacterized protein n=1 Tax=Marispirochaeta aestuarii TaxID=1963862 RepID=A0A1Y1RTY9_9SPIO|nr:hypothetical protein B4O97_18780 [Marispirochaeta aestuarii]